MIAMGCRSQPEAKACNHADTAVFCNTEMAGCAWMVDAEHKVQVDCGEPDPGHLIVHVRRSMTHLLDTEVSLLGVAVEVSDLPEAKARGRPRLMNCLGSASCSQFLPHGLLH